MDTSFYLSEKNTWKLLFIVEDGKRTWIIAYGG
jgi:hypothetical protein